MDTNKPTHKSWRRIAKKLRRKKIRRAKAIASGLPIRPCVDDDFSAEQQIHDAAANETELRWLAYDSQVMKKWHEKQAKIAKLEEAKELERKQIKMVSGIFMRKTNQQSLSNMCYW